MSGTTSELYDDTILNRADVNVKSIVSRLKLWRTAVNRNNSAFTLDVNEALLVPSRMRCKNAFASADGKKALREGNVSAHDLLITYDQVALRLLRALYQDVKEKPRRLMSEVSIRLAQVAFELNMLHECVEEPSARVLDMLGEKNPAEFERVRSAVIDNVFFRLQDIIRQSEVGLQGYHEKYDGASSCTPFLNELFANVADPYAMELQNALEFAGFDLESPEIVDYTLNSHQRFFQKDPAIS